MDEVKFDSLGHPVYEPGMPAMKSARATCACGVEVRSAEEYVLLAPAEWTFVCPSCGNRWTLPGPGLGRTMLPEGGLA